MKMLICLLAVFIGLTEATGQKFVQNEFDKFNKSHRLKTDEAKLLTGLFAYMRTVTYDTSGNTYYFIRLTGTGKGANVIGKDEQLIFLLDNDSTVTVYSTEIQSYDIGRYSNTFNHQYQAKESDIKTLANRDVKSIRKHGSGGYIDFEIPERNQSEIKKLALLVLKELKK